MVNSLVPVEAVTTQITPPNTEPHQSDRPTSLVCDLSEAKAFCEDFFTPHVPVLTAFGGERMHMCRLYGAWDLERVIAENGGSLFRSIRRLPAKPTSEKEVDWDDLTFRFGPRTFVYVDRNRIVSFASTHHEAEQLVTRFGKSYSKPPQPTGGVFHLIQQDMHNIRSHEVTLSPDTILSAETIGLHYGRGCVAWHQEVIEKLREKPNGLLIFEGSPGTGKTCYLRHLMGELRESHRFYFIPTSTMGVLSRPDFIGFWTDQRRAYSDRKFVVVLEDSDAALMTRGSDNREQVSAILNLSDGMLADFLRLQIICTINCTAAEIDPALLRPGRLLSHHVFSRLDYPQAVRLAEHLGRKLSVERAYSLAEVFAEHQSAEANRSKIGFAG